MVEESKTNITFQDQGKKEHK
ncbi:uncharacterized protein G2W53_010475 [Senna tora]|uniref:Uncharacterized protein n=1 Tax=Senna tora TaxID=362788 RepID=A0A835C9G7_9FABA|nr:uncharacterized protein G2W53_010475 [Senna tora]